MKTFGWSRNGFFFLLVFIIFEIGLSSDVYSEEMDDHHKGHNTISSSEMGSMDHGNAKMSNNMGHSMTMGKPMEMKRPVRWEEGRTYSPPPALMGNQMGVVETLNIPALGYELDGKVKVFTLIAQPMEHIFTDGKPMDKSIIPELNRFSGGMGHMMGLKQKGIVWGYNGSMPGPTIEATEGDTIRVILINELPEPTSIHWHGLEVPNEQDGAAGVTEAPTLPGETHIYEFTLYQSGTFMYHTGFNVMKQDALGLGGLVVVHP
ncbi:MAG: multicopper oxidase domain-containing protein, partial [Nitrospinae bacterium]|nr:multicopper oxidase domain-containing protein [Nitrospinota bacterium]